MENHQPSQLVSNSHSDAQSEITSKTPRSGAVVESPETILETQSASAINSENNNSFELKKWMIFCTAGVLAIAAFFLFAKETDVCFLSTCNDYSDSIGTDSISMENNFLAYASGTASLIVLTTLVGVPLLPAVAISTGVWFLVQMIQ